MKSLDVCGKKFGKLTVIEPVHVETKNKKKLRWRCICDCGNEKITNASLLVNSSLPSCGCAKGKTKIWTNDKFVTKAKEVHAEKFDYSKAVYTKSSEPILIICKTCGYELHTTPNKHLQGGGCVKCSTAKRAEETSTPPQEFIEKCKAIHGDKFDYSETFYTRSKNKVRIKCNTCGYKFSQAASAHLGGKGCKQCAINAMADRCRDTQEDFIRKARETHGERYDYSLVSYKNAVTDVDVICTKHGKFTTRPNHHINGSGCEKCGKDKLSSLFMKSQEQFITEAREIHKEKQYDYSKVKYTGAKNKVTIGCSHHGDFDVNANSFLAGCGCASCANWGFDFNAEATLYVLKDGNTTKVGITGRDVEKRLAEINKDSGRSFIVIKTYNFNTGRECYACETAVLDFLKSSYKSPMEKFDGYTECFYEVAIEDLLIKIEEVIIDGTS